MGSEFDLIRRFFTGLGSTRADVLLDVGDDCALLDVPPGEVLAVSLDTLVADTHFFADADPEAVGYKSLAVGLSDLAAMGATPAWATLALTLPAYDEAWLAGFARGFGALATRYGVRLVGGDTTRGPLSISVQVHGRVPPDVAVRRAGARAGDDIWVSGTLGDAALALAMGLQRTGCHAHSFAEGAAGQARTPPAQHGERAIDSEELEGVGGLDGASASVSEIDSATASWLRARLERPTPRVELGVALRGLASAMIDLSDGLSADLGHILTASGVGAEIRLADLPLSHPVAARVAAEWACWSLPLASGDDYELCWCAPPERAPAIRALAGAVDCALTCIGSIRAEPGLVARLPDDGLVHLACSGYDHFGEE